MVVKTGPMAPKDSGFTKPLTGPSSKPIVNNHKTSGIFVLSNKEAK